MEPHQRTIPGSCMFLASGISEYCTFPEKKKEESQYELIFPLPSSYEYLRGVIYTLEIWKGVAGGEGSHMSPDEPET